MRFTQFEISQIKKLVNYHFGANAKVYLFGSRTDDTQKGGDIDLLIQNSNIENLTITAKIRFLAQLKQKIGNQKIDVILDNSIPRRKTNFYNSILKHAVSL